MDALVAAAVFECGDTFVKVKLEMIPKCQWFQVSVAKSENDVAATN
jgi:hypothetical protein